MKVENFQEGQARQGQARHGANYCSAPEAR